MYTWEAALLEVPLRTWDKEELRGVLKKQLLLFLVFNMLRGERVEGFQAKAPVCFWAKEKSVEIPEVERRHLRYTMHNLIICSEGFGLSCVMYTFPPGKERFCLSRIQWEWALSVRILHSTLQVTNGLKMPFLSKGTKLPPPCFPVLPDGPTSTLTCTQLSQKNMGHLFNLPVCAAISLLTCQG